MDCQDITFAGSPRSGSKEACEETTLGNFDVTKIVAKIWLVELECMAPTTTLRANQRTRQGNKVGALPWECQLSLVFTKHHNKQQSGCAFGSLFRGIEGMPAAGDHSSHGFNA